MIKVFLGVEAGDGPMTAASNKEQKENTNTEIVADGGCFAAAEGDGGSTLQAGSTYFLGIRMYHYKRFVVFLLKNLKTFTKSEIQCLFY